MPKPKFIESLDYSDPNATMSMDGWLGEPPEYFDTAITETLSADVVVCGGGLAGVAAARSAAEEGASVILFEKCASVQGRSAQFSAIGGKLNERWGRGGNDLRDEIINNLMRAGNYFINQRTIAYWADNSGAALDWYVEALPNVYISDEGLDHAPEGYKNWIDPICYPEAATSKIDGELFPTYQLAINLAPTHVPFLRANLDRALETGLCKAFFNMPAKKLLQGPDGRVSGVIAEGFDGRIIKAAAKKGVVLATGDYAGNHDMLYYYCPWVRPNTDQACTGMDASGYHANTGDGHRMAMWLGARMEDCPHASVTHNMGGRAGVAPFLQLDMNGERFMNEDCGGQELDNQIKTLPGRQAWQIMDSSYVSQLRYMAQRHGSLKLTPDGELDPMMEKILTMGIIRGELLQEDTLDALLKKTGMPADVAMASIERYNELARSGVDSDFGKAPSRLFPIEKPPFYASSFIPTILLNCVSGIDCDHNGRCFNGDRGVIPGLYLAGNVQGRRFSGGYPTMLPGLSHSMALTFGKLAGKNAAASF